jgi:hypothetical protein
MDPPGRFLQYSEASGGWRVAPSDRVVTKTLAALRELRGNDCPRPTIADKEDVTQSSPAGHQDASHPTLSDKNKKGLSPKELVIPDWAKPGRDAAVESEPPSEPPPADELPPKKYPKHAMISKVKLKLPSDEELKAFGLSNASDIGPPRLQSQEGPRVREPHPHDVLFGRGQVKCSHIGNIRYRRLVWANKGTYTSMTGAPVYVDQIGDVTVFAHQALQFSLTLMLSVTDTILAEQRKTLSLRIL